MGEYNMMKPTHCVWKILLIVAHAITLIATVTFNFMGSGIGGEDNSTSKNPLYKDSVGGVSDRHVTGVTPAGWTFTIWSFIYTWQFIHVIYSFTLLFRKNNNGEYLYNASPAHIHYSHYIVYMMNNAFNTGWIFLFDREEMIAAVVFAVFIALTIYISAGIVAWSLNKAGAMLETSGQMKDIWMTRLFTLNGLAFYGTWCTIAILLNFSIVLRYRANLDMSTSCWVPLGILTSAVITWFILENFVLDRYLRYVFAPYIVLPIAFSGVISKQWHEPTPHYTYYTAGLFALVGCFGVVKLVVMIVKGIRNPINYDNIMRTDDKMVPALQLQA